MVSNEVASLEPGEARPALLLTPKSRIVAPLRVVREGPEDVPAAHRGRARPRPSPRPCCARASRRSARSRSRPYRGYLHLGEAGRGFRTATTAVEALRELERRRARGRRRRGARARCGSRPARPSGARSSTRRSCPPRPGSTRRTSPSPRAATRARSRSRGCTTAAVRTAACACSRSPTRKPGDEIVLGEKPVGRVTSAVPGLALGYVRREVPDDAALQIGGAEARLHLTTPRP